MVNLKLRPSGFQILTQAHIIRHSRLTHHSIGQSYIAIFLPISARSILLVLTWVVAVSRPLKPSNSDMVRWQSGFLVAIGKGGIRIIDFRFLETQL
jgi:hypothetical protein